MPVQAAVDLIFYSLAGPRSWSDGESAVKLCYTAYHDGHNSDRWGASGGQWRANSSIDTRV
jgi:hypothetical protein